MKTAPSELNELFNTIGERVAYYRKQKGINQSELARELEKDRQAIQRIEAGKVNPTIKTLFEISKILEVTIEALIKK